MPPVHRDVSPVMRMIRAFLLGRQPNGQVRFADELSSRSPPPPNLPPGPACKLADNYYYTRDGRREIGLAKLIVDGTSPQKQIAAAGKGASSLPTPGARYMP
ncbi:NADH dehydrogenase [ubiquinone] 1 alpha subcomplex subunit 7-like [Haemaphysalis longicornis]